MTNCLGLNILNQLPRPLMLKSKFSFLRISTLESIYFLAVLPSVLYGVLVWGSGSHFKDLDAFQTRAARLIHILPRNLKDEDVLSIAKWPSLPV